jgi:Protein of unknown function (DUF1616)
VGLVGALLLLTAGLIWAFWPKYEEQFIEFGLLGKNKRAEDYFANANSTVTLETQSDWYIYVHNHMENSQNIIVRVKLLNSTMAVPNDQEHNPSPYSSLYELPMSLSENETLIAPFYWTVTGALLRDDSVVIERLTVNEQIVNVGVSTPSDSFFRIVFELWVQDSVSKEYKFGWQSGEDFSSASVYMGFTLNPAITNN